MSFSTPNMMGRNPRIRLLSGDFVDTDLASAESVGEAKQLIGQALDLDAARVMLVNSLGAGLRDSAPASALRHGHVTVYVLPNPGEEELLSALERAAGARSFSELAARRTLRLSGVQALPDCIGGLRQLQELYFVSGNSLAELPRSFGNLTALRALHLDGGGLRRLPRSLGQLASLQTLHLANNQLEELPESIGRLCELQTLQLSGNKLAGLPGTFSGLGALQQLYLHDNQLEWLPDTFGDLEALRVLYLRNNLLKALPGSFVRLKALRLLYLSGNPLQDLPPGFFDALRDRLRTLEVDPGVELLVGIKGLQQRAATFLASFELGLTGQRPVANCSCTSAAFASSAAAACAATRAGCSVGLPVTAA